MFIVVLIPTYIYKKKNYDKISAIMYLIKKKYDKYARYDEYQMKYEKKNRKEK